MRHAMIFIRGLWAFLLGLLAGSVCFVQFGIIPFWKTTLDPEYLGAFQAIQTTASLYFPILMGLCLGLGLIFSTIDLHHRTRLIPDPWSQPWASTLPTICLLIMVGVTAAYLMPISVTLKSASALDSWDQSNALLLKWARLNGVRTLFAILAFAVAARSAVTAAFRS